MAAGDEARPRPAPDPHPLAGVRILVVEDEPLIAMDIEERLLAAGGNVIGPAANPETARRLIAETAPDAALLDANLAGSRVDDLAVELRRRRVPFAFATGFGRESLPPEFADVPVLAKPFGLGGAGADGAWRSSPGARRRSRAGPTATAGPSIGGKAAAGTQSVASGRGRQLKNRAERPMKEHRANERQEMRRLYHQPLSPFCRKIRLVLAEKKIEVELVEERPWERRMDFLRMNPAGQVPVLRIDDLVLADSAAIFEYLEETHPEPPLLPKSPALRAEARRLTAWFDDKFHNEVTANLLYERVNKKLAKAGYPESEKIKAGTRNIKYHLDYIGWLMDHRRWLAGDMLTIADFAAAAHLSCLDYVGDVDWTRNPALHEWYAKIKSRPAFRSILADLVPGFTPPQHYADLDF